MLKMTEANPVAGIALAEMIALADTPGDVCANLNAALWQSDMIAEENYAVLPQGERKGRIVDHGLRVTKSLFGGRTYHRHIRFDHGSLDETRIGGRHAPDAVSLRLKHDVCSVQRGVDLGTEGLSLVMSETGLYVQRNWKPKNKREIVLSAFEMTREDMAGWHLRDGTMQPLLTVRSFQNMLAILQHPVERAFDDRPVLMRNGL